MLKNNFKYNQQVAPNQAEINKLKETFPQYFNKEGEFLFEQFQENLSNNKIELNKEGYELRFLGKSYARYLSSSKTETFLSPDTRHNSAEQNILSSNIYIYGDNLDALKHLLGSYASKIKCIYIDPPYNTGSDGFVYNDSFNFSVQDLVKIIGISEEEAERILALKNRSSHSAWLTFIYPRLVLARELLTDDGVIFISIDDNEMINLKMIGEEIFGEANFVGCSCRVTKKANNKGDFWAPNFDYILTFTKNRDKTLPFKGKPNETDYKLIEDTGPRTGEKYQLVRLYMSSLKTSSSSPRYWIECPDGSKVIPPGTTFPPEKPNEGDGCWRWGINKFNDEQDNIVIKKVKSSNLIDENGQPAKWNVFTKLYLKDAQVKPKSLIEDYINQNASKELNELDIPFDYAKPSQLIKYLFEIAQVGKDDIILDFFSGSATTAEAVMRLNVKDGGNRKYILVQLPEIINSTNPAAKKGYKTIDEIGRARIAKAAKKIKAETNADIDYGYKLFALNNIDERHLTKLQYFEPTPSLQLDNLVDIFDTDIASGKDNILTTWIVQDGYGLTANIQLIKLDNYVADLVANSLYFITEGMTTTDVLECIKKLENLELDITRIVVYSPSVSFNILQELRNNLNNLRNNRIELIERF